MSKSRKGRVPSKSRGATLRASQPRDKFGRFLPRGKPNLKRPPPKRDVRGRFLPTPKPPKRKPRKPKRDALGRFVARERGLTKPERRRDGRKNDRPRLRNRFTFEEMIEFYGFEEGEIPDWTMYLEGAP